MWAATEVLYVTKNWRDTCSRDTKHVVSELFRFIRSTVTSLHPHSKRLAVMHKLVLVYMKKLHSFWHLTLCNDIKLTDERKCWGKKDHNSLNNLLSLSVYHGDIRPEQINHVGFNLLQSSVTSGTKQMFFWGEWGQEEIISADKCNKFATFAVFI